MYKFEEQSLLWFISYLKKKRQQEVITDQGLSDFTQVKFGVPQGSIFGPTLFLPFINDILLFLKHCLSDFTQILQHSIQAVNVRKLLKTINQMTVKFPSHAVGKYNV